MSNSNSDKYIYELKEQYPKLLNEFLAYRSSKGKAINTIKSYGADLEQFFKFIKVKRRWTKLSTLDELKTMSSKEAKEILKKVDIKTLTNDKIKMINVNDIDDYFDFLSSILKVTGRSQCQRMCALKSFYKYMMQKKRMIDENIMDFIEKPDMDKKLVTYLTESQAKQLLVAILDSNCKFKIRDHCLVNLFINTGLRLSELINLDFDKINLENKTIKIKGKGDKEREVPITNTCVESINQYIIERNKLLESNKIKEEYKNKLFISREGNEMSSGTIYSNIVKYGKMIGIHIHPHMLRHTAGTLMSTNDVPINQIQKILGHENIATTTIYADVSNNQLVQAVEVIEKVLNR